MLANRNEKCFLSAIIGVSKSRYCGWRGTFQVDCMAWSKGLDVEAGGHGIVSHAGSAATRLLAGRAGLTGALSGALARRGFTPLHDRGRVLIDLAVAIADGGTTIGEIDT